VIVVIFVIFVFMFVGIVLFMALAAARSKRAVARAVDLIAKACAHRAATAAPGRP
jgi:hypothetical protein